MNKKLISEIVTRNIYLLIFAIIMTMYSFREVFQAIYAPNGAGTKTVESVSYTLFQLKLHVVDSGSNIVYTIYNYALIPIILGIVYNMYFWIKYIKKYKDNSIEG